MIEGLIGVVIVIVETIASMLTSLFNLVITPFVAAGETLAIADFLMLLIVLVFELIYWLFLYLREVVISLLKWKRPSRVARPRIWRPKAKSKVLNSDSLE